MTGLSIRGSLLLALLGASSGAVAVLEANRQQLTKLEPMQLTKLKQQFDAFDALPSAEKDRLRKLHDDLARANSAERAALDVTMTRYNRWLDSLTDQERDQIHAEHSTVERIKIVQTLVRKQNEEVANYLQPFRDHFERRPPGPGGRPTMFPRMDEFTQEMENKLREQIEALNKVALPPEKNILSALSKGPEKGLYVGLLSVKYNLGGAQERVRKEVERNFLWRGWLGEVSAGSPTDEEMRRYCEMLALMYRLPEPTPEMLLEVMQHLRTKTRDVYRDMAIERPMVRNSSFFKRLILLYYYTLHPTDAPADIKGEFTALFGRQTPPDRPNPQSGQGPLRKGTPTKKDFPSKPDLPGRPPEKRP